MSRPLRIEFPGAVFHVTSRGDRREPIYRDDADRVTQLAVLDEATSRFDASVLAYCLMGNHYHLVLCTRSGALSRLMRHLNGVYTQAFNRRHGLVGHLFQGRFKAVLVDSDRYLATLSRYVERNPVAAGLVEEPESWPWSSCRAHLGLEPAPLWLAVDELHGFMLGRDVATTRDRSTAIRRYSALVSAPQEYDADFWKGHLNGQVFLGDEAFAERARQHAAPERLSSPQVPTRQRKATPTGPRTWPAWLALSGGNRDRALHNAYSAGWKTMPALAEACGLSVAYVSRVIRRVEREERGVT
jgi:putative transposase